MQNHIPFTEKYYVNTWADLFLPQEIKTFLEELRRTKPYRLLLHSTAGTGKTSTANTITKEWKDESGNILFPADETLFLSGSNDFNVDVLRAKILPFATGCGMTQRTIIIDECEWIRPQLQDSFKKIFDLCKHINFIFITNDVSKVKSPIRSRCKEVDYNFSAENLQHQKIHFLTNMKRILVAENIEYDPTGMGELNRLKFPDMRAMIEMLEIFKIKGHKLTKEKVAEALQDGATDPDLYEIIQDTKLLPRDVFTKAMAYKGREDVAMRSLGEPFFVHLNGEGLYDKTLAVSGIVAKYSTNVLNTVSKTSTFFACIVELRSIFR